MKKDMIIALPEKLYVLRPTEKQDIIKDSEEYNIYFENIILPYSDRLDIKVNCDYGKNFGHFWRISEFPYHVDSFPLEIAVYDEYGECVSRKSCTVVMTDKKKSPDDFCIMCIGDSMTHTTTYMNHIRGKLRNLHFSGIRSFDGHVYAEGRGGWTYKSYFENKTIC